jgi:two-component system response regulator YesN
MKLCFTISSGVGCMVKGLIDLQGSYGEAEEAIDRRFFKGNNSIIFRDEIKEPSGEEVDILSYKNQLIEGIKIASEEIVYSVIRDFINALKSTGQSRERCLFYIHVLIIVPFNTLNDLCIDEAFKITRKILEQIDPLPFLTLDEAGEFILSLCRKSIDCVILQNNSSDIATIAYARQYIQDHYSDPKLTLSSIASALSVSVSYFCLIFKKNTGETFSKYLTHLRMEKAKEILSMTVKNIYEVAEMVGYAAYHSFSVAFKNSTGLSPTDYRTKNHCLLKVYN